jgi:CopG antitoxin of type II toxin-antitoxin system
MSGTKTIGRDITLEEFDAKFDRGEDISDYIDWSTARRPNLETKRVNVDFPAWVVAGLDRQAKRLGVTRQALIKMWIAERVG